MNININISVAQNSDVNHTIEEVQTTAGVREALKIAPPPNKIKEVDVLGKAQIITNGSSTVLILGTTTDAAKEIGIPRCKLSSILSGNLQTYKGWRLSTMTIREFCAIYQ